jgi:hypothetical protein
MALKRLTARILFSLLLVLVMGEGIAESEQAWGQVLQ